MARADSLGLSTKQHYVTITRKHLHSYIPQESCMPIPFPVYQVFLPFLRYHDHRFLTYASREHLFNQVKNMIKSLKTYCFLFKDVIIC